MTDTDPTCCELACYEDPGCCCDGCEAADAAATPAPLDECPVCRWQAPDHDSECHRRRAIHSPDPDRGCR